MKDYIKPLSDYIVAKPQEVEDKTSSGIYLPKAAQENLTIAETVAVGSAVTQVKVGDKVIYKGYSVTEINMDEKYLIIKEEDILAVIEKEKK